ncbi:MAG: ribosomal-protein-alanine N-acetyltransferase [Cypionkella sp.]|nr:ribosomal-protein-alanine N-acetyltransferase [Cypionkella sp.]
MAAIHAACFVTPRPWSVVDIAGTLASPFVFVLTEPHGFLIGRVVAGEAELLTLAVDPRARQRGTGGRLVDGFLAEAAARGGESAFLEVLASNLPAQSLYARKGFVQKGKRSGYYHTPDGKRLDALVLTRAISSAA